MLSTPEIICEGGLIGQIYKFFVTIGFGVEEFFVLVCFGSASLLIAGTTIKILAILSLNRFVEWTRHELSTTLIELTLNESYQASMNQHSSETANLVISEADKFISDVLRPTIVLISNLIVGSLFIVCLVVYDPKVALGIFLVLAAIFAVPLLGLTGLLKEVGEQRLRANNERTLLSFEILRALKEIKTRSREKYFSDLFVPSSKKLAVQQIKHQTLNHIPAHLLEALMLCFILASIAVWVTSSGVRLALEHF